MTIAAVTAAHGFAQSANGTSVVATVNTSGSSSLIVGVVDDSNTTSSFVDLGSNIWVPLTAKVATGSYRTQLYHCARPIVGSGHTFTVTSNSGSSFPSVVVQGFSGTSALALFDSETGLGTGASGQTSIKPGAITPNLDGAVLVTMVGIATATTTPTPDSGFTRTDGALTVGGLAYGFAFAYLIQTTRTAIDMTWSWTTGDYQSSVIAAFDPQIQDFSKELSVAQAMKRASWY